MIYSASIKQPIDYVVRTLRDGRSFCSRTVDAIQNGATVFTCQISFHLVSCISLLFFKIWLCFFSWSMSTSAGISIVMARSPSSNYISNVMIFRHLVEK